MHDMMPVTRHKTQSTQVTRKHESTLHEYWLHRFYKTDSEVVVQDSLLYTENMKAYL